LLWGLFKKSSCQVVADEQTLRYLEELDKLLDEIGYPIPKMSKLITQMLFYVYELKGKGIDFTEEQERLERLLNEFDYVLTKFMRDVVRVKLAVDVYLRTTHRP